MMKFFFLSSGFRKYGLKLSGSNEQPIISYAAMVELNPSDVILTTRTPIFVSVFIVLALILLSLQQ